jgi:hypothetical protein
VPEEIAWKRLPFAPRPGIAMTAPHHSRNPPLHFLIRLTLRGIAMIAALCDRKVQAFSNQSFHPFATGNPEMPLF